MVFALRPASQGDGVAAFDEGSGDAALERHRRPAVAGDLEQAAVTVLISSADGARSQFVAGPQRAAADRVAAKLLRGRPAHEFEIGARNGGRSLAALRTQGDLEMDVVIVRSRLAKVRERNKRSSYVSNLRAQ